MLMLVTVAVVVVLVAERMVDVVLVMVEVVIMVAVMVVVRMEVVMKMTVVMAIFEISTRVAFSQLSTLQSATRKTRYPCMWKPNNSNPVFSNRIGSRGAHLGLL